MKYLTNAYNKYGKARKLWIEAKAYAVEFNNPELEQFFLWKLSAAKCELNCELFVKGYKTF